MVVEDYYVTTRERINQNSRWSAWSVHSIQPRRRRKRASIKHGVKSIVEWLGNYWRPKHNKIRQTARYTTVKQNRSPISDESRNDLQML